ncbi:hypothetical protein ACFL53_02400 [Pseudomonadota bacterium]
MYAKYRSYTLAGKEHLHVHLAVNPTGFIDVEIMEKHKKLNAEFEDLCFEDHGDTTELDCVEHSKPKHKIWYIYLSRNDAKELTTLIDEAKEEYEIIMRDLC